MYNQNALPCFVYGRIFTVYMSAGFTNSSISSINKPRFSMMICYHKDTTLIQGNYGMDHKWYLRVQVWLCTANWCYFADERHVSVVALILRLNINALNYITKAIN